MKQRKGIVKTFSKPYSGATTSSSGPVSKVEKKRLVLKVQSELMRSVRRFFEGRGLLEVLPPVFEPFTDSGIGAAGFFEIDYYGKPMKLLSALTIHKPLIATEVGSFFAFTPCARREPESFAGDGRHLAQFYQVEVETLGKCDDAIQLLEEAISFVLADVKSRCRKELDMLGRELKVPSAPFKRITYGDVVAQAKELGFEMKEGDSISTELEKALSGKIGEPFFITGWPKSLLDERGFLYKGKDGSGVLLDFDLIMPERFGEVSSGSERESDYAKIVDSLKRVGRLEGYAEYLELAKRGLVATSGFGIGVERLTKFVCGLEDIAEASAFPKVPGGVN